MTVKGKTREDSRVEGEMNWKWEGQEAGSRVRQERITSQELWQEYLWEE